jgi:ribosomal protein S18 acetylase RimI-like enzyme
MTRIPIEYHTKDIVGIDLIRPLWDQLNEHHRKTARVFKSTYMQWIFEDRKAYFGKVAGNGPFRIDLAFDPVQRRNIGYCVSSLSPDKTGEIESVYVEEGFRSQGIGTVLVTKALAWLNENGSVCNRVSVADGNEDAFPFYQKFGFYPRMTVLEQKKD